MPVCARTHERTADSGAKVLYYTDRAGCMYELKSNIITKMEQEGVTHSLVVHNLKMNSLEVIAPSHNEQLAQSRCTRHAAYTLQPFPRRKCTAFQHAHQVPCLIPRRHWHWQQWQAFPSMLRWKGFPRFPVSCCTLDRRLSRYLISVQ